MSIVLSLCGMIGSVAMLKYREKLGDMMGEPDWMRYVGGVYNFIIILAIFIFFWSLATITGTTDILFKPLLMLFPSANPGASPNMPGVVQ